MKLNIETVMTKHIKGGKEVVKYNPINGKCWVERCIGDEIKVVKSFEVASNKLT